MHWTVKVDGGPRRVNHAAVELNGFIYSFGGFCSGEHHDGKIALDIHVLDTETYRWRKLQTRNEESMGSELSLGRELSVIPYQRYGHTVVAYQGKAYLWGGRNDTYGTSSKMHVFDPETCTWSLLDRVGQCPPARDGHSAVVYEDKMFIFGGFEDETQRFEFISSFLVAS
ncbi:unnamed protein product [Anisakis simplex]|uniref:Kelch domain-containing protein 10 n=1 Tax=Anisakis simplex TaxID=6269 RepID=A0A0M3J2K9_ANISI|nr:unnamed protein product [Anisakis simplex]